jgi:pimeloyl-ACP methyl ester carboxylesterase
MIERELPEADRAVLAQERWRSALIRSMLEAVRQGDAGWLDDGRAFTRPWGFPLSDVRAETRVWQGELDVLVPRAHGDYLARKLPNAEFELVPNEGHMLVSHTPIAFGWLAEAATP